MLICSSLFSFNKKNLHTKNYEILSDNNIRIFEYVDNPGIVNSLLVNHGISVDECTVTKESLEDYFQDFSMYRFAYIFGLSGSSWIGKYFGLRI